jgi:hypothetical protein
MSSTSQLLTQTADRFEKALAIAYRQYPPPCLSEIRSKKEEIRGFSYFLLPCSACPLGLSPDTCPHRHELKTAIADAIASAS